MKNKITPKVSTLARRRINHRITKKVIPSVQNRVRWPAQDQADLIWEPVLDEIWNELSFCLDWGDD
jgi:hypothetical protein